MRQLEVAVIRVAAKLVDGRSLGQVLMAFPGGGGDTLWQLAVCAECLELSPACR